MALFGLAAVAEIGGAWLVWQGVREHRGVLWVSAGVMALGAYGFGATLQDEVPPVDFTAIRALAEAELGAPLESVFASVDPVPVAAASLGQAHRGRLSPADAADAGFVDVVVKVQRPGIEKIVDVDLAALRRVAGWLDRVKVVAAHVDLPVLIEEFVATSLEEIEFVRTESQPYLLEVITYRYRGHSMGDPERYRKQEEVKQWQENDPIGVFRKHLLEKKTISAKVLDEIDAQAEEEVNKAVEVAESSPEPGMEELFKDVYVEESEDSQQQAETRPSQESLVAER